MKETGIGDSLLILASIFFVLAALLHTNFVGAIGIGCIIGWFLVQLDRKYQLEASSMDGISIAIRRRK